MFNTNAGIVPDLTSAIADNCPKGLIVIMTNPVNWCVPIAVEVLKSIDISVIGGHSGVKIIPVISQCKPKMSFSQPDLEKIPSKKLAQKVWRLRLEREEG